MNHEIELLEKYDIIYKYIIKNINILGDYESINNILNFNSKKLINIINNILIENSHLNKIKLLYNIYENIKNEMTLIYNLDGDEIFSTGFVVHNKNKCYLLINNKKYDLCSYLPYDIDKKNKIKIKLIETKKITDLSRMFGKCTRITSLDISQWNSTNVTDMSYMFEDCFNLLSLNISNLNTINITEMYSIFSGCEKLLTLSGISNWNTINVTNMRNLFTG